MTDPQLGRATPDPSWASPPTVNKRKSDEKTVIYAGPGCHHAANLRIRR